MFLDLAALLSFSFNPAYAQQHPEIRTHYWDELRLFLIPGLCVSFLFFVLAARGPGLGFLCLCF